MIRNLPTLVLVLAVVSSTVPAAQAYHLSAGASDTLLMQPAETPFTPSVPGELQEIGRRSDCDGPQAPLASSNLLDPVLGHPFCGQLRYHEGTVFETIAPGDQDIPWPGADAELDVVRASYVGTYGLSTCLPWCTVGGSLAWDVAHGLLYEMGLAPDEDEAREGDGYWQRYSADVRFPDPLLITSESTGLWEADGWMFPITDLTFVGWIWAGELVGEERLRREVQQLKEARRLPPEAVPSLCGFTPDARMELANSLDAPCEVLFRWTGEPDGRVTDTWSYDNPCGSPAYLCGAFREAWQAEVVCPIGTGVCGLGGTDRYVTTAKEAPETKAERRVEMPRVVDGRPGDSTTDYVVWHFVVAPTPSDCNGAREPGFTWPYLAHDLDVYVVSTQAANLPGAFQPVEWATDQAREQVEAIRPTVEAETYRAWKDHVVEPNAAPVGPLADTSRSAVVVDRNPDLTCNIVDPTLEVQGTVDPYIDLVDGRLVRATVDVDVSSLEGEESSVGHHTEGALDAYPTTDAGTHRSQDASNRASAGAFVLQGKVGLFTDLDDDGRYDQAAPARVWDQAEAVGAYPLFWDLRLTEAGTLDHHRGCYPDRSDPLSVHMYEAGYGVGTGLFQALYLREPVTWTYEDGTQLPFREENIYLFMSQGTRVRWEAAEPNDPVVQAIESVLDGLRDHAEEVGGPEPAVIVPFDRIDPEGSSWRSDFQPQCGEPTGGFTSRWTLHRTCSATAACQGGTAVTAYLLDRWNDMTAPSRDAWVEPFVVDGEVQALPEGFHVWLDVDPLDGDPERNEASPAPPTRS